MVEDVELERKESVQYTGYVQRSRHLWLMTAVDRENRDCQWVSSRLGTVSFIIHSSTSSSIATTPRTTICHAIMRNRIRYFASSAIFIVRYASKSKFLSSGSDMTTEHTRRQLLARTVGDRLCIPNRRGKGSLQHTVPAGRLRLWRHGLLRELRLRLLYQRLLVFVFPIDLVQP